MKEIFTIILFIIWIAFCAFSIAHCIISQFDTPAEKEQKKQLLKQIEEYEETGHVSV